MSKYKIVIVENDDDELIFLQEAIESSGRFEILAIHSSGDALMNWLKHYTGVPPDGILSDLFMPGKSGYDLITVLKANPTFNHIPVFITSILVDERMTTKCLTVGAAGCFPKPASYLEYLEHIEKLYHLMSKEAHKGAIKKQGQ